MFDEHGRVWVTARIRPDDDPAYCRAGSATSRRKLFPLATSGRQVGGVRSEDRRVQAREPVLRHAPSAVRATTPTTRCGTARRPRRSGLAGYQRVPRDRRRRAVAGLDAVRRRHGRHRQAYRQRGPNPASRSIRPKTRGSTATSTARDQCGRRLRVGLGRQVTPARSCTSSPAPIRRPRR